MLIRARMSPRRVLALTAVGAVLLGALACNAILGTPVPVLAPDADAGFADAFAGDAGAPDASLSSDVDAPEASPLEGGPDADPALCCGDGGCVPVSASPDNCGACGHSCQGGACDAGTCGPTLLVGSPSADHGLRSLSGLTVLGGALYGTNSGPSAVVYQIATDGYTADPRPLYPADPTNAANAAASVIVHDESLLYFAVARPANGWASGIYAVDLLGHGTQVVAADAIAAVAVDSSALYWSLLSDGSVWRGDKDGGSATSFPVDCGDCLLLAKGGNLYFTTAARALVSAPPADPATGQILYSGSSEVEAFDVGSTHVFWADAVAQRIYSAPIGSPSVLADITPPGLAFGRQYVQIMTDDAFVYLEDSDYDDGAGATIRRFSSSGTGLETMATLADGIGAMTQDTTTLYFTTHGNDTAGAPPFAAVWKLAK